MRELIFSLYVVSTLLIPFLSQWIFGALMRTLEVLKRMDDDYGVGVLLLIIPGWIFPWTPLLLGSFLFLIVRHAPAYYLVFLCLFTWLFDSWRSLIKFEIILEKFLGMMKCCITLAVIKTSMLGSSSWNHIAIHLHFHLSSPSCHSFVPLLPCCSAFLSSFSVVFFLFECVCSLNSLC